jgi:acyl carrier protein
MSAATATTFMQIRAMLAEQMAKAEAYIQENTHLLDDLGMDEQDAMELALGLEEAYSGGPFTDKMDLDQLRGFGTVGVLSRWVERVAPRLT